MNYGNILEIVKELKATAEQYKDAERHIFVKAKNITTLCNLAENAVPSIDLLQARIEAGCKIDYQDKSWCLFDKHGECVTEGNTLRDILLNLIWIDC